jgi:hypothetical protein
VDRVSHRRLGLELVVGNTRTEGHSRVGNGALTALGTSCRGRRFPLTQRRAGPWSLGVRRLGGPAKDFLRWLAPASGIPGSKRVIASRWLVCGAYGGASKRESTEVDGKSTRDTTAGPSDARRRTTEVRRGNSDEDERVESRPLTDEHLGMLITKTNRAVARACDERVVLSRVRQEEFGNFLNVSGQSYWTSSRIYGFGYHVSKNTESCTPENLRAVQISPRTCQL